MDYTLLEQLPRFLFKGDLYCGCTALNCTAFLLYAETYKVSSIVVPNKRERRSVIGVNFQNALDWKSMFQYNPVLPLHLAKKGLLNSTVAVLLK